MSKKYHTVFNHIRQHLFNELNITTPISNNYPYDTDWWCEFLQRQAVRFIMGKLRYGEPGTPGRPRYNCIQRIKKEIERYEKSKDPEALIEIANHAVVEYTDKGFHLLNWTTTESDRIGTTTNKNTQYSNR